MEMERTVAFRTSPNSSIWRWREACSRLFSTRAAIGLYRASQALALLEGRDYVVPDDVKSLAIPVLAHRLIAKTAGLGAPTEATADCVREILATAKVPT